MLLTIIIMCVALAVILIIAYMLYNDYQVQKEIDKKVIISKQKTIINECDDLLLSVVQIPCTTKIVVLLQNRILGALQTIIAVNPQAITVKQRIDDIKKQISDNLSNPIADPSFSPPKDTDVSLKVMKVLRRLRKIIRIEFNRGRISQQDLIKEDKRLEIMIFKIQFSNLYRNIEEAKRNNQTNIVKQLVSGGLSSLKKLNIDDNWLKALEETLTKELEAINQLDQAKRKENNEHTEEDKEIDMLFMPKKKW